MSNKATNQTHGLELEPGAASIFITLVDGEITVYHGETFEIPEKKSILHNRPALKGDWDRLWDVIRDNESKHQTADPSRICIGWTIEDVQIQAEQDGVEITEEQCRQVLGYMERKHDANIGINWDFISHCIEVILKNEN